MTHPTPVSNETFQLFPVQPRVKLFVQSSDIARHIFAWSQQKINLEDLKRVFVFNSYSVCVCWQRLHYKTTSCVPSNFFKVAQQLPELVSCSINMWP